MAEKAGGSFFPSSRCHSAARGSVHVHCPCENRWGKAVNPKTQQQHLLTSNQRELIVGREIESGAGGYAFTGL